MAQAPAFTYQLRGREIVDARVPRTESPLMALRNIGLAAQAGPDGRLTGRLRIPPLKFDGLADIMPEPVQAFVINGRDRLNILAPSPLSRCGAIPFSGARNVPDLIEVLAARWRAVVEQTHEALALARQLAPNARVALDPWRLEGQIEVQYQQVRLLFSPKGNRACINGLNGRPMVDRGGAPRVMLPVPLNGTQAQVSALWKAAIKQATACTGPVAIPVADDEALSLDLADDVLVAAYEAEAKKREAHQPRRSPGPPVPTMGRPQSPPRAPRPARPERSARGERTDHTLDFCSADLP